MIVSSEERPFNSARALAVLAVGFAWIAVFFGLVQAVNGYFQFALVKWPQGTPSPFPGVLAQCLGLLATGAGFHTILAAATTVFTHRQARDSTP